MRASLVTPDGFLDIYRVALPKNRPPTTAGVRVSHPIISRDTLPARFDIHYRQNWSTIYNYAARRVGEEGAKDIASDVFIVGWNWTLETETVPDLPWLLGVARNTVRNYWRAEGRRKSLAEAVTATVARQQTESANDGATIVENRELLARLCDLLSEEELELLLMSAWEELNSAEIGDVIHLSPGAVRVRLTRIRQKLRTGLADNDRPTNGPHATQTGN